MAFSIIICTYNPDVTIFKRLLNAVISFGTSYSQPYEIIIVDNNSQMPVSVINEVKHLQRAVSDVTLITEKKPGLTAARTAGIQQAKYDWIIFFDDDNEPDSSYLINASKAISEYPNVAVWGPGVVTVELMDKSCNPWFEKNLHFFQERSIKDVEYDNALEWKACYPFGTGMIIKTAIAQEYAMLVRKQIYSLSDRVGKKLASGGDTQMVLHAVSKGVCAGISPLIKVNHIIDAGKTSMGYLLRQTYMTASCYVKAFNEVKSGDSIELDKLNNYQILKRIYTTFRIHFFKKNKRDFLVLLYNRLGEINARYLAAGSLRKPLFLYLFEKFISV